ncbi:group I truncated hemoglobin [Undibacterium sp. TJN25]|uniref:group I truncated hemoglobin n=1 Tax=Undibacterium sp. TJN25 TaxID=3413056 RepID=UPI003BF1C0DA
MTFKNIRFFQMHARVMTLALALAFLSLGSAPVCALAQSASDRLYQSLGAEQGIGNIVDDLVVLILQDERIKEQFKETNMKNLAKLLKEQFCVLSGGRCKYTGDDMKLVHGKMGVTDLQFNALVEDLQTALDKNNVPSATQNKLIALLAPMHRDIVLPLPAATAASTAAPSK